jgi:hypothetical protein
VTVRRHTDEAVSGGGVPESFQAPSSYELNTDICRDSSMNKEKVASDD